MVCAVRAVAVAMMSSFFAPPQATQKLVDEFATELFASRGLRWLLAEECAAHDLLQHRVDRLAFRGDPAAVVVWLVIEACHHAVDHHVARARVEGDYALRSALHRPRRYPEEWR